MNRNISFEKHLLNYRDDPYVYSRSRRLSETIMETNARNESVDTERLRPPLPEDSILSFEDYMAMQKAISNEDRYLILRALIGYGELSASAVADTVGLEPSNAHYHLGKLESVGLVQNRRRKKEGSDGHYSYYVATSKGETILSAGVDELMRREWEYVNRYETA